MKIKLILALGIGAQTVAGQSVIEQIGWKGSSWTVVASFFLAIAALLGFLAAYYSYKRLRQKENTVRIDRRRFTDSAKRLGLTDAELSFLHQLLDFEPNLQPQLILQSVSVFEKCVDKQIAVLLSKNVDNKQYEQIDHVISSIRRKAGFHHMPNEYPLISTRNISIGQSGSIFGKNHHLPLIQKATVVDSNEFVFTLEYDIEKEEFFKTPHGDHLKFAFARAQDGMYGISLRIAKANKDGVISAYHTLDLKRNQMRRYLRVSVNFPIRFRLLRTTDSENGDIKRGEQVDGKILDLSGGGLSFICERSLKPGDLISTSFSIPGASFSGIACKILRIGLQEGKSTTYYKHHAQFINFEEQRKRDQIVKYVFEKQRQQNQWR